MRGTVKSFNPEKGYGFVDGENGQGFFVHYSEIMMNGFKTLRPDEEVEFDTAPARNGKADQAINVRRRGVGTPRQNRAKSSHTTTVFVRLNQTGVVASWNRSQGCGTIDLDVIVCRIFGDEAITMHEVATFDLHALADESTQPNRISVGDTVIFSLRIGKASIWATKVRFTDERIG